MKKLFLIALCACVFAVSCDKSTPVTGIKLDQASLDMIIGDVATLTATITPNDATDDVKWTSSNDEVVTVNVKNGEVLAKGEGSAVVTVSAGKHSASCDIRVMTYPEIGDFYYSDGSWSSEYDASRNVIGLIFQTYKNDPQRFGEEEKATLMELGIKEPKALVVSCKWAGKPAKWSLEQKDVEGLANCVTQLENYMDISGLHNTNVIRAISADMSEYPAFKTAVEFSKNVPAPAASTGWFLPSAGQCWDMLQYLGLAPALADESEQQSDSPAAFVWGDQNNTVKALNDRMSSIPSEQKDEYPEQAWFWSSTEYSANEAMNWDITAFGFLSSNCLPKMIDGGGDAGAGFVRAVLAF